MTGGRSACIVFLVALVTAACQPSGGVESRLVVGAGADGIATQFHDPESALAKRETQLESSGLQHFIEFRSRYAYSYGHSFAIFGRLNASGEIIEREVAGLHPATDSPVPYLVGHVVPVPSETGASDGDLEDEYMSASWKILLSEAEYEEVLSYIRKLQASSPVWHAALYNCNAFVADIARSMGYRTPAIWLRPQQFVTSLHKMNLERDGLGVTAHAWTAPSEVSFPPPGA